MQVRHSESLLRVMRLDGAHALEAEAGGEAEGTLVGRPGHHHNRLLGQLTGGGAQCASSR